jgi:predicted ATP-grasp superfamily ATP-dependent carboligase
MEKNSMKYSSYQADIPIAFILGKYTTTGIGIVRCLKQKKIPIIWIDSNSKHVGFYSRYCKGLICPDPKNNADEYINFLLQIGEKLNHKGVLFPIRDIEVITILKNRSKLEKSYHIPFADLSITEKLLNKKIFYKILEDLKIEYPNTYFPKNLSEVERISKKITYPCILKPYHSAVFYLDFNIKLFKAESKDQLVRYYKRATLRKHEVMIQEIIPGNARDMYGLNAYYDRTFTPNGIFIYRRIREWPHEFGNGCFIEQVNKPELEQIVNGLIKEIDYYGIVDAEFRKDPRDGKFKFIEINPRCWMQVCLPANYGINYPYIAYMDANGKRFEIPSMSNENIKYLFMIEDFLSSLKSIKKGELSIREWIKSYKGKKVYAIFCWSDPIPFFVFILKSFHLKIK